MRGTILLAISVWLVFTFNHVMAEEIEFLTHNIKKSTFIDANGELRGTEGKGLRGFLIEVVREMMTMMNHKPRSFKDVPFVRGLKLVQNKPNYALFNISRTTEREGTVKWVGPTYKSATYFYKQRGSQIHIESMEDAKKIPRIGVQNGSGNDTELTALGFKNLIRARTQGHTLQMMMKGRVDLVAIGENVIWVLAKESNVPIESIERTPVKLWDTIGYIAFSNNISDETVQKWQGVFDRLYASNKYQELIQKYYIQRAIDSD